MDVRGSLATAMLLAACATGGCAAPAEGDDTSEEAPAPDEPLDIVLDSLDVVHGVLRFGATMVDGAADVSVRLGGNCDHREVGGGLSTPSTLLWSLPETDVADAIGCGLSVRARVRDGGRFVNRVAEIGVTVDVAAEEGANPDDGPQLQSVAVSPAGIVIGFASVRPGARLSTGDSFLEAEGPGPDGEAGATDDGTAQFVVPRIDFARVFLGGRDLRLDGSSFVTSLSTTSTEPEAPASEEEEEETATDEPESQG
jgi:hypothetical protein